MEEEFERNLKKFFSPLRRYIQKRVAQPDEVEEILQETLIAASESYCFFKGKSSFWTWLCGIANHEIIDYYRKKKIKMILFSHFPFLENLVYEVLSPDEELEKEELRKEVKKVLNALSEGYQEVLRLKYYQGLSMAEIARKLKITVKAVESRLSRARVAFRLEWEKMRA